MTDPISPAGPPAEITHLVRERTEARSRRDWARADALKAQIEGAGWRIIDRGNRTSVSAAAPASVELNGEVRYGSAAAVPSLLDSPAATGWTVVVLASEEPARVSRLLAALRAHASAGTQVVVVANDPSDAQVQALTAVPDVGEMGGAIPEVLRTSARLGYAAALNIGLRRCAGEFVVLADGSAWPVGDAFAPLAAALADTDIAVAGGFGLVAAESGPLRPNALRREAGDGEARPEGSVATTALEGAWLAFRRSDYIELGPLDEHFVTPSWLDVWWSLRLRAGAEPEGSQYVEPPEEAYRDELAGDDAVGAPAAEATAESPGPGPVVHEDAEPDADLPAPCKAVRVDLPLERDEVVWPPDRSRLNRRNMYRVLDRFGWRDDLA